MKLIHGLALALTLSVTSSLRAQNAPPAPAPAAKSAQSKPEAASKKSADAAPAESARPGSSTDINPPETTTLQRDNVNVRGRPSFLGEVITRLKKGEPVTLLEEITLGKPKKDEPAKWYRIAIPSNTPVWVSAHFVDSETKEVQPRKLQVRAGPGENYSVVGSLRKGEKVKEIRTVGDWLEIEPPAGTYAFVAAELIDRAPTSPAAEPTAPPVEEPAPEIVQVPTTPENPAIAEPIEPPVIEPPAPAEPVAPPVVVEPPVEEPLPRRIVTREGIVRRSLNVQTPSYFELESPDTKKTINYLYSSMPGFTLKSLVGARIIVTGEELIDKRWRNTPVIEIENLHVIEEAP